MENITERFPRHTHPPIYLADSMSDFLGHRQSDIESGSFPFLGPQTLDQPVPPVFGANTEVTIIPKVSHEAELDKRPSSLVERLRFSTSSMSLSAEGSTIAVKGCILYKNFYFPFYSRFYQRLPLVSIFDFETWENWRRRSWQANIIILSQLSRGITQFEGAQDNHYLLELFHTDLDHYLQSLNH